VVSEHVDGPPVHFVAVWAAINFKPFFRVAHPAVLHVATAVQQSIAGSLLTVPLGSVPSFAVSLNLSVGQVTLSDLHFRGSSIQQSFCTQLPTSFVEHTPHFDVLKGAAHAALATSMTPAKMANATTRSIASDDAKRLCRFVFLCASWAA